MDTPFLLVSTARINLCNCFSNQSPFLQIRPFHHSFPFSFLHVSPQSWGLLARGPSKSRESLAVFRAKEVLSFLSYFKTLSIGPALGIEPTTYALQSRALPTELILQRSSNQFQKKVNCAKSTTHRVLGVLSQVVSLFLSSLALSNACY